MTPRLRTLATLLLAAVLQLSCSDAVPCTNCPKVGGTYTMAWGDAGVTDQPCPTPGLRPAMLTLEQNESRVNATLGEVRVSGTLYDSYDLAMTGLALDVSYQLKALVIPTGTSLDGGIRLTGHLTTRRTDADAGTCETRDPFEGTKHR